MPGPALETDAGAAPAYFGKLPARGDFIGRRFSRAFLAAWDPWLQSAVAASREALGEAWLERYLVSPLWRFYFRAGACGPNAVAGVFIPSVDTVGRYFPFVLAHELAAGEDVAPFAEGVGESYAALEALVLSALGAKFDPALLDRALAVPKASEPAAIAPPPAMEAPALQHIALGEGEPQAAQLSESLAAHAVPAEASLWWTSGCELIAPCLLVCAGLPAAPAFAAMLDGEWTARGWSSASGVSPPPPPVEVPAPSDAI